MIPDNLPYDFDKTAGNFPNLRETRRYLGHPKEKQEKQEKIGKRRIELWNADYLEKSKKWGDFIVTKTIYKELFNPPVLTTDDMIRIFGKVPNTRNPKKISRDELKKIAKYAGINFITE